jgi:hypothetical protein
MEVRKMTRLTVVSISLILISLMLAGVSFARIDPETCVGLWLFDEGKGNTTKDFSGKGNNGTLISDPKWVNGQFGKALEFNGSSNFVQVPHADNLTMTKEITVEFWFTTGKKMGVFEDRQAVVGKHYLEYEVGIYPSGGVHTYTSDGAGNYDEGINCSIAGKLPEGDWILDKWYHLAWTLNGRHEIVYVNGKNIGEYDKAHEGTRPGAHTLEIGRRQGGSLPLKGAVDEAAVFNVVLKEDDIKACMEKGMERVLGITAVFPSGKLTTTWGEIKK